jgi:Fe2+ or Zn2+ uptake regulation protein
MFYNDNDFHYRLTKVIMNPVALEWNDKLENNGYRSTPSRRAVVDVIATGSSIMTAADIYLKARLNCPRIGLVTVYRTLEKLENLGLIQRVHQDDNCHSYIAVRGDHQHLLICESCKRTVYFNGDDLFPLMVQLSEDRGFIIQHHWLQLSGLCKECQTLAEKKNRA